MGTPILGNLQMKIGHPTQMTLGHSEGLNVHTAYQLGSVGNNRTFWICTKWVITK